jgi:hypothetical protein
VETLSDINCSPPFMEVAGQDLEVSSLAGFETAGRVSGRRGRGGRGGRIVRPDK